MWVRALGAVRRATEREQDMKYRRVIGAAMIAASAFSSTALSASAWTKAEAKAGAQSHKSVMSRFGGAVDDRALSAYVERVAKRIIRRTPKANEPWVVTVLDVPVVNAFATQGGYIYVTRGLLALANSEAELAAVLGHEIAHITAKHVQGRKKRSNKASIGVLAGAILGAAVDGKEGLKKGIEVGSKLAGGYVAQYSQKQEYDADLIGMRYMVAAGYDPLEAARFLASMAQKHKLEAEIAGKQYNPNQVDFFASHPATGERVARASRFAQDVEMRELLGVDENRYMGAIDGMIYGDSPAQGFVRGRDFIHPQLRFRFRVPDGFVITNSAAAVASKGPNGGRFTLESGGPVDGSAKAYIQRKWAPALAKKYDAGKLGRVEQGKVDGLRVTSAYLPLKLRGKNWVAQLSVVEHNDRFFRFTGLSLANDKGQRRDLERAVVSFRRLSDAEARAQRPYRLDTVTVRGADTVNGFVRQMPAMARAAERFVSMNGLASASELRSGDIVKVITP